MAKTKSTNPFPGYIRIKEPDKNGLAELTVLAKGEKRSLTEFAKQCGVSVSTLSRVVNAKSASPNSDDLIAAIARNSDPASGVTIQQLLEAHGLAAVDLKIENTGKIDWNKTISKTKEKTILNESMYEEKAREILQNELLTRGYNVMVQKDVNIIATPQLRYKADFVISTDALVDEEISDWAFDVHIGKYRPIIQKLSWVFGAAYLDSMYKKGMKFTIITNEKEEFDIVKERFKDIEITDCISIILVDFFYRKVINEFQIPMLGKKQQRLIFEQK